MITLCTLESVMNWKDSLKQYRFYLKIERGMSDNTVVGYEQDVNKLITYLDENSIEQSGSYFKEELLKPARDIRKILEWGYPKFSTIRFVADHF